MSNILRTTPSILRIPRHILSNPRSLLSFNMSPGFFLASLANMLWGASFLASKYTIQAWEPFTASSLRFGIATILLFIVFTFLGKK